MNLLLAGMPLNIDWRQILLHVLNLVILFLILYFLLYKPVRKFMEKRRAHYEEIDNETARRSAEAEAKKEEYESLLADEKASRDAKLNAIREDAEQERLRLVAEAEKEASSIIDRANERAAQIKIDAENRVKDEFSELIIAKAREELKDVNSAYDAFLKSSAEEKDE